MISGDMSWNGPYIHGLGVGDIDGDGMFDIVTGFTTNKRGSYLHLQN